MAEPVTTPLPAVKERMGQWSAGCGAYRVWYVLASGYSWRVRAAQRSAAGAWGVRVEADTPLPPAEASRLAEYVARAAATCEQRERERAHTPGPVVGSKHPRKRKEPE